MAPRTVRVEEVPDPTLQEPTDAIIEVTATAIRGSDLHLYDHGASLAMKPGDILRLLTCTVRGLQTQGKRRRESGVAAVMVS